MLPALFVLFVALIIRSLTLDGAMQGVKFFLQPDFSKITSESILFAMGQSFFAISIGISIMVTYSSYLNKRKFTTFSGNNCWTKPICFSICRTCYFSSSIFTRNGANRRARITIYRLAISL